MIKALRHVLMFLILMLDGGDIHHEHKKHVRHAQHKAVHHKEHKG
jgi:hypothetical protein